MLERIEEIQGIGLLHEANGKRYGFRKTTLIYADNGRGKSTLAAVLRSVSTGDASLVSQRKTVDGTLPPKVSLQFASGHKVTFNGGVWSEKRPELLVFDMEFVERNVHSGAAVSTGHRRNLLEFALGEAAVAARTAVDKSNGEAKAAAEAVQRIEAQLSGHHAGMSLPSFEALPAVPDVESHIAVIQKRLTAAADMAAIAARALPAQVQEPTFNLEALFEALGTSLENVHADAEKIVKQHVQKLGSYKAEGWLSVGQQFGSDDTCPYCAQATVNNDLIRAYQTHFNAAYRELKAKVATLHGDVEAATAPRIIDAFAQGVALAKAQADAWNDQVQTQSIAFDSDVARAAMEELRRRVSAVVQQKQAAPAESFGTATVLDECKVLWDTVVAPMRNSNAQIKAARDAISAHKGNLAAENVPLLQQELKQLQAAKLRHDPAIVDLIARLASARRDRDVAEATKKEAREKLDGLMTATLKKYEKDINALLRHFGASFQIKDMGANFRGAAPRSEYVLSLRGADVVLEGGSPSFATTLSEGDKRTLAFAFFVASTLTDPRIASRIVAIDDPMCSLDLNRKHHTKTVLTRLSAAAEQLIVLAHDPYFIRDVRDALQKNDPAAPIALVQLVRAPGDYSTFDLFDVDKECESAYSHHHRLLNEFVAGSSGDIRAVAKAIRPMLEGYLHRRFLGLLPKSKMFGQLVVDIRDAVPPSPLCHAHNLVTELNRINEYAGQFHHDTNPDADKAAVVASELKTYVESALLLVHGGLPHP